MQIYRYYYLYPISFRISFVEDVPIRVTPNSINFKKSFAHIIFNHSKRLKSVVKNYSVDLTKPFVNDFSQEQVKAYFAMMEH